MKSAIAVLLFAYNAIVGAGALGSADTAVSTQEAPTDDRRSAMIAELGSSGPRPSLGANADLWDRFVGTWDCEFGFFLEDGSFRRKSGELHFGWILDGGAVQDIWISYPTEAGKNRSIGTSLRTYHAESGKWRVIFLNPDFGAFISVEGEMEGDRIILRGLDIDGAAIRWSFNEIKSDSFIWRGEKSPDGGKTWRLEEQHVMKRKASKRAKVG